MGQREGFAVGLCWQCHAVQIRLGTRRNVCSPASFSTLIKTAPACLPQASAEPTTCQRVPRGQKLSKPWQWAGMKCRPEELEVLAGPLKGGIKLAWILQPCFALCQLCSSAPEFCLCSLQC